MRQIPNEQELPAARLDHSRSDSFSDSSGIPSPQSATVIWVRHILRRTHFLFCQKRNRKKDEMNQNNRLSFGSKGHQPGRMALLFCGFSIYDPADNSIMSWRSQFNILQRASRVFVDTDSPAFRRRVVELLIPPFT